MLPSSLVPQVSKHPVVSAVEGSTCSDKSDSQERMLFQLNQGEEEEASSFVPLSIAGNRAGRPMKWSLAYLRESTEEEGGMVVGGGSFGETSTKQEESCCVCELFLSLAQGCYDTVVQCAAASRLACST